MKLHIPHLNNWGDFKCSSDKGKNLKSLDTDMRPVYMDKQNKVILSIKYIKILVQEIPKSDQKILINGQSVEKLKWCIHQLIPINKYMTNNKFPEIMPSCKYDLEHKTVPSFCQLMLLQTGIRERKVLVQSIHLQQTCA